MIKDVLLSYIIGKYRGIIVIFFIFIGLLAIGHLILFENFLFGEIFFGLMLSFFAFLVAIYNGSLVGFPAVNIKSNDFDITMRIFFIALTSSIFLYISYSIF